MASRLATAIIISLVVVAGSEGFVISSLYAGNANYASEISSLRAQLSQLQGSLYPMTVVDDLNRTVTINHEPERIVSLEPSDTQIVFAIGEGGKVVGATTYDDWPTALANSISSGEVVAVGGVLSNTISVETVAGLRPDLVLAWGVGGEETQIIQQLSNIGLPVLVLAPQNMNMIYSDVLLVGRALDAYQNATNVVGDMRLVLNYVSAKVSSSPRPTVFYEVWNDPLLTAGAGSFIGQLISIAGGTNIFSNVTEQFPTVSPEAVVSLNPQVIVATNEFNMTTQQIADQPGFGATSAAQNGRIYVLSNPAILEEPAPRLIEGLLVLAELLHPDLFSNITLGIFNDSKGEFNESSLSQFS